MDSHVRYIEKWVAHCLAEDGYSLDSLLDYAYYNYRNRTLINCVGITTSKNIDNYKLYMCICQVARRLEKQKLN